MLAPSLAVITPAAFACSLDQLSIPTLSRLLLAMAAKHLLRLDVSPRGECSISRRLGDIFVAEYTKKHAGANVTTRDLAEMHLPFVDMPAAVGTTSDPSTHDEKSKAAVAIGNELIAELQAHDEYVLTTPMYNFAVPAKLKAYIDHVVRNGKTFRANDDSTYTPLLTGKRMCVLMSSAGEYDEGQPAAAVDFLTLYLKHIFGFVGVTDLTVVRWGSSWKVDRMKMPLEQYLEGAEAKIAKAVQ